jgi:hypothetical protein
MALLSKLLESVLRSEGYGCTGILTTSLKCVQKTASLISMVEGEAVSAMSCSASASSSSGVGTTVTAWDVGARYLSLWARPYLLESFVSKWQSQTYSNLEPLSMLNKFES